MAIPVPRLNRRDLEALRGESPLQAQLEMAIRLLARAIKQEPNDRVVNDIYALSVKVISMGLMAPGSSLTALEAIEGERFPLGLFASSIFVIQDNNDYSEESQVMAQRLIMEMSYEGGISYLTHRALSEIAWNLVQTD